MIKWISNVDPFVIWLIPMKISKKICGGKQELLIERNKSFRHPQRTKERKSDSLSLSLESLEPENIATLRSRR